MVGVLVASLFVGSVAVFSPRAQEQRRAKPWLTEKVAQRLVQLSISDVLVLKLGTCFHRFTTMKTITFTDYNQDIGGAKESSSIMEYHSSINYTSISTHILCNP